MHLRVETIGTYFNSVWFCRTNWNRNNFIKTLVSRAPLGKRTESLWTTQDNIIPRLLRTCCSGFVRNQYPTRYVLFRAEMDNNAFLSKRLQRVLIRITRRLSEFRARSVVERYPNPIVTRVGIALLFYRTRLVDRLCCFFAPFCN